MVRVTAADSLRVREARPTTAFDLGPYGYLEMPRVYGTKFAEGSWA